QPSIDALRADWALTKGDIFRQSNWEAAKRNLVQEMILVRYPLAELADSRAEVDVKTGLAALTLTVNSGPAVVIGELAISGLTRFPASTISNLNPIRAGRAYRQAELIEFQRRLQDTGYFQRVEVSAEIDVAAAVAPANADPTRPDAALVAPVRVTVEEQKMQRVELGAGYSTNTGSRGQVAYERLNLFGTAVRLKSALLLETRKQSGHVSLAFPTSASGERDSLSTWLKREDVQNETTRTSSVAATRAWGRPANETTVTVLYSRERKDVTGDSGIATTFNQSLSANLGQTWRRTDNLLSPTRGYLLNLQAGGAPFTFLTSARFGRLFGKATGYFPLGENQTVILRAEAGAVIAAGRERIPADFLFRAGGDQSVRGYGYQQLGVKEGAAIVGGRYLALASAEIIHWLAPRYPTWGVAAFVDAGNAADRPADLKPVYGYGVGARWKSPVGVVNLDIAYGQQVRQARLHFSLGVSF
ncbi:MAG: BamA/TamA family outer membrane protein, partial [Betaproteobacteria bacterium]